MHAKNNTKATISVKPNLRMITNIRHFLDDEGNIPEDLPVRARNIAERLGEIICRVSSNRELQLQGEMRCWRRINRRRCPGDITAYASDDKSPIEWFCWECAEGGIISD